MTNSDLPLIKPITVDLTSTDGDTKQFLIGRFPAIDGREIMTQYLATGAPKIGDYSENVKIMQKAMKHVAVITEGEPIRLVTDALINNHCDDWEMLMALELEVMKHNTSFFTREKISQYRDSISGFSGLIMQTWRALLEALSTTDQPPSKTSEKPTITKTSS